ncbi:hypothetical protein OCU04_009691 [Sclerotinia nivalis]|uniref:Uncharacterized protein n=1 Tax=Sclerotinia nivalis TaxID=352851 RepID=A0A9X0AFK5_9HELO|nr:hypothetical protein OCU04_009691 [Sclerotinia nivalis]
MHRYARLHTTLTSPYPLHFKPVLTRPSLIRNNFPPPPTSSSLFSISPPLQQANPKSTSVPNFTTTTTLTHSPSKLQKDTRWSQSRKDPEFIDSRIILKGDY